MKGLAICGALCAAVGLAVAGCAGERRQAGVDAEAGWTVVEAGDVHATVPMMLAAPGSDASGWPRREEFAPIVREIAERYRSEFTVVSPVPKWAPMLCSAQAYAAVAARPKMSASGDQGTHGQKLYYLYASDLGAYLAPFVNGESLPIDPAWPAVGTTLVKASWTPVRVEDESAARDPFRRVVRSDGVVYETGEQRDLFIMTRLDPMTPETDNGWVYATVHPETLEVQAAGRIASCMACHVNNGESRLFGVPSDEADRIVRLSILGKRD
ncbi:MAG: hypothetical protein KDA30_07090 [Phycisphaerales bacterium]|nr:hypothetical protein [Phycisphaerales bacterium]